MPSGMPIRDIQEEFLVSSRILPTALWHRQAKFPGETNPRMYIPLWKVQGKPVFVCLLFSFSNKSDYLIGIVTASPYFQSGNSRSHSEKTVFIKPP